MFSVVFNCKFLNWLVSVKVDKTDLCGRICYKRHTIYTTFFICYFCTIKR